MFAELPQHVRAAMLEVTDVWSSNAEEAEDLLVAVGQTAPADLADLTTAIAPLLRGDAVAIVRDGPEGCGIHVAGETTYVPGYPQKPVDTNGAGDTHTGALLAEVAAGTPWVEGCRRANAAAAIKVTRRGPESAPTADEVDEFLARQPAEPSAAPSAHADPDRPGRPAGDPEFLVVVLDALTLAFLASLSRTLSVSRMTKRPRRSVTSRFAARPLRPQRVTSRARAQPWAALTLPTSLDGVPVRGFLTRETVVRTLDDDTVGASSG